MALDRQSIEKKDFPIGRRGYDPDAVDTHLRALADEVDDLRRSSRRRTETLAAAASEQVRVIVEAAESSAAEIRRQAEEEAHEIRGDANSEAQATREDATIQAREYVAQVSESTSTMLQRLEAMDNELNELVESLRTGSNRLNAELQLLESNLGEVKDAVGPRSRYPTEPEAATASWREESQTLDEADLSEEEPYDEPHDQSYGGDYEAEHRSEESGGLEEEAEAHKVHGDALAEHEAGAGSAEGGYAAEDTEGARLIALNMALNGTPRDEIDRYLAENFQLSDRGRLLDEVYASVEG